MLIGQFNPESTKGETPDLEQDKKVRVFSKKELEGSLLVELLGDHGNFGNNLSKVKSQLGKPIEIEFESLIYEGEVAGISEEGNRVVKNFRKKQ